MKKFITLLLAIVMMLGVIPAQATSTDTNKFQYELLTALKLIPNTIDTTNLGDKVTRETVAYALSRLSGAQVVLGTTEISDTDELNKNYITAVVEAGIMSADNGVFNPDGTITAADAKEAILKAAAGNVILTPTEQNKIFRGYKSVEGNTISNKQFFRMVQNALDINVPRLSFSESSSDFTAVYDAANSKTTVLAQKFDVSVYEGTINAVDEANLTATVDITKNVVETNPQMLPNGEYILKASQSVNLNHFEYAPVKLWVQGEDIVYMELQKYVEIRYSYIYAVNSDTTAGNTYAANFIDNIHYYGEDDAYDINKDALRVVFNNKETATGQVSLIGNFAKTILREDEVEFIQAWDLTHGGIVTDYSKNVITYTSGRTNGLRISNVNEIKKVVLYTDGRSTDIGELKANTLFDYYKDDDTLIIVASEKVITGTFDSLNSDYIEISGTRYYRKDDVYFSTSGTNFDLSVDYSPLFGREVDVFFTYNGYASYVRSSLGVPVQSDDFLATMVKFIPKESGDTVDEEMDMVVLFSLEGDNAFEKITLNIEDMNGVYYDGITPSELTTNSLDPNGNGVYIFKLNARGNICAIKRPTYLTGYSPFILGGNRIPIDATSTPYLMCPNSLGYNSVVYFEKTQHMIMMNAFDRHFEARTVGWGDLAGLQASNVTIHLIAEEENSSQLRTVIFCGIPSELVHYQTQQGIITEKNLAVDEDGKTGYEITVIGSRGKRTYYVTEEYGEELSVDMFIEYSDGLFYSENDISVTAKCMVSGPMKDWNLTTTRYRNFEAVIYKIDGNVAFFEGGTSGTIHKQEAFVIRDRGADKGKYRYEMGTNDDLLPGRYIRYTTGDSMKFILVEIPEN